MKKILVPIDFSKLSLNALDYAVKMAKEISAQVDIINIVERPGNPPTSTSGDHMRDVNDQMDDVFTMKLMEKNKIRLRKLSEKEEYKGYIKHFDIRVNNIYTAIADSIAASEADLLVMGTSGTEGLEGMLFGSHTIDVVDKASCPVLVVKEDTVYRPIKNIVFPSLFDENITEITSRVKEVAKAFNAKLHLLRVNTNSYFLSTQESDELMENFAKTHNLTNYTTNAIDSKSEEKGILDFTEKIDADVVAIMTHAYTGFMRIFHDSIAEGVSNEARVSVMMLNIEIEELAKK